MSSIFIDSNVPMYLVGGEHPNKQRARLILERLALDGSRLVTSAEAFQELCHRYTAIKRSDTLVAAFDLLEKLVDQVHPVTLDDVRTCRQLIHDYPGTSSRDALHAAVTKNLGIGQICSFDEDFDRFGWLKRVS